MSECGKIHGAMIGILRDCDGIAKGKINQQQGFKFRGIDDCYNELHVVFAKHGVYCTVDAGDDRTEERETKSGTRLIYRVIKYRFTFWADDGSSVASLIVCEAMDSGDKAANKALSIGHKYALLTSFLIPVDVIEDADASTPPASKPTAKPAPAPAPTPASSTAKQSDPLPPLRRPVISAAQRKRLWAIVRKSSVKDDELKAHMLTKYHIEHTADIHADDYDAICAWAQGGGK